VPYLDKEDLRWVGAKRSIHSFYCKGDWILGLGFLSSLTCADLSIGQLRFCGQKPKDSRYFCILYISIYRDFLNDLCAAIKKKLVHFHILLYEQKNNIMNSVLL